MGLDHVKDQDELTESDIKKQMDSDGIKQEITQDAATKEATAYITRLLKKRKWTGEEAGKTLVYNLVKNAKSKPTVKEASKWQKIIKIHNQKLQNFTETNKLMYLKYHAIWQWLLRAHALATAHQQSFFYRGVKISETVKRINTAEFISHHITLIYPKIDSHLYSRLDTLDKFTENKEKEQEIESIKSARTILLEEFYFTRGYCKAIELIADYLKINALNILQVRMRSLYKNMEAINDSIKTTASNINDYVSKDKQAKKLEILKKVFEPIEITWHISDNTIALAKDWLKKREVFQKDALYFIELFTAQEEPQ
ncbi:hypothetical protein AGMMS49936_08160 [Endomicrobiia bacterium]|nr:hypothetical protein AGMMS49936_08160 [Endomicrobiia bacterium]